MRFLDAAIVSGVLLIGAAVQAAPVSYSGKSAGDKVGELSPRSGNKIIGTSKCAANEATIDVVVDGKAVTGSFREKGGQRYQFAATSDAKGAFSTDIARNRESGASSGGPSHSGLDDAKIHIRGTVTDSAVQIVVEDSCIFRATLTKK